MKKTTFSSDGRVNFKFMKGKEDVKQLILHIIGLVVYLSPNEQAKLSLLGRILKKEANELKPFCHELGLSLDPIKSTHRETGKKFDDLLASTK